MTSNCSRPIEWFKEYYEASKDMHRVSVTASYHREHVKSIEEFGDKLEFMQKHGIQITINMVMIPDLFEEHYKDALYFHERGINVTLKPQSDPTASFVVEGYTDEMMKRLHNGMPQRNFTDIKSTVERPKRKMNAIGFESEEAVPAHYQIEFTDSKGKKWYMDQAERFNAFNFNKFEGWECSSGYRSIIIREPDGTVKRSYSCGDIPLGHVETGFKLYDGPKVCISGACVSSADSKIPKRRMGCQIQLWNT
jgi:hypothetical protein